jgi:Na+/proline symporter
MLSSFLLVFIGYTLLVFAVTFVTSRRAGSAAFYTGNRRSPWFAVAYGMIGASISGVTFISLPGNVMNENFYYLPMVFGFLLGYVCIALVLLPLYYRMNLTSIYAYLEQRFGGCACKTGAAFFILSRTLVTSLRLFLVISILYEFVLKQLHIPFWAAAAVFVLLILLYTVRGGVKTIVWTDLLQTTFMVAAVVICTFLICRELQWSFGEMAERIAGSGLAKIWDMEPSSRTFFVKQLLGGFFVCVAMTGLDQEMMQKNLSCRRLRDAQKNMFTFSGILLLVNFLFLVLGALLVLYVQQKGLSFADTDRIFPAVATQSLGGFAGWIFIIGLISAAYPSADGALTSITTSFCIDILGTEKKTHWQDRRKRNIRYSVHAGFAFVLLLLSLLFAAVKNDAVITMLYTITSYTYGSLLGFFFFGLLTRYPVRDRAMPLLAVASPLLCFLLDWACRHFLHFGFGFSLLMINGLLTFGGMWICREKKTLSVEEAG